MKCLKTPENTQEAHIFDMNISINCIIFSKHGRYHGGQL